LPVARFLIPKYLTYENGDCAIEVFLLITAFKLASSFGLVFWGFREVVGEDLEPGVQYPSPNTFLNSKKDSNQLQLSLVLAWLNSGRVFSRKNSMPSVPLSMWTSAQFRVLVP
jgi:hypothetical protein